MCVGHVSGNVRMNAVSLQTTLAAVDRTNCVTLTIMSTRRMKQQNRHWNTRVWFMLCYSYCFNRKEGCYCISSMLLAKDNLIGQEKSLYLVTRFFSLVYWMNSLSSPWLPQQPVVKEMISATMLTVVKQSMYVANSTSFSVTQQLTEEWNCI